MSLLLIWTFGICFRIHTPRLRRTPLKEGTRGGGPSVVTWWNIGGYGIMEHRKTRKTRIGWTEWIQMARRQRPLSKGVPREWRGMYTAGGASTNIVTAYKDFWYLFLDTYPPASPYPSEEGTRGGGPPVVKWLNMEKYVIMEHRKTRKTRIRTCISNIKNNE